MAVKRTLQHLHDLIDFPEADICREILFLLSSQENPKNSALKREAASNPVNH